MKRDRRLIVTVASVFLVAAHLTVASPRVETQRPRRARTAAAATEANPIPVLWRQPRRMRELDFVGGPGGAANAPRPPFKFTEENTGGSNPKVDVTDATGRKWGVKWGTEVNAETFATRLAWAAGYFVEPAYFVAEGRLVGVDRDKLDRAKKYVESDGTFHNARFELKEKVLKKYKDEEGWAWNQNPFVGSRELNGLKLVVMLTSDWDSKDARDAGRGSNTAIYLVDTPGGVEARYLITDWGGSMGKWGNYFGREKWDCDGFAKQTPDFIKGVENGFVKFGYSGQRTSDVREGISVADVQWFVRFVGRITDEQFRAGLRASGATPEEVECFTRSLRNRIEQMRRVH